MEQTNLVVTPDGKTWDEVTRDVSYIGNTVVQFSRDAGNVSSGEVIFDETRGYKNNHVDETHLHLFNKDFAIAYDRHICLRDGEYEYSYTTLGLGSTGHEHNYVKVNGVIVSHMLQNVASSWITCSTQGIIHLKRGDYITVENGAWDNNAGWSNYNVRRLS